MKIISSALLYLTNLSKGILVLKKNHNCFLVHFLPIILRKKTASTSADELQHDSCRVCRRKILAYIIEREKKNPTKGITIDTSNNTCTHYFESWNKENCHAVYKKNQHL